MDAGDQTAEPEEVPVHARGAVRPRHPHHHHPGEEGHEGDASVLLGRFDIDQTVLTVIIYLGDTVDYFPD